MCRQCLANQVMLFSVMNLKNEKIVSKGEVIF